MAALPQCDAFYPIWDQTGSPSVNTLVTLQQVVDDTGDSILSGPKNTFTDDTGNFHFTLPQGASVLISSRASGIWSCNGGLWFTVPSAASGELVRSFNPPEAFAVAPPLEFVNDVLLIPRASLLQDGYLAAEDFAAFAAGGGPGVGTVTRIDTANGVTGGPITTTGTIGLEAVPGLTPGTYTNPTIQVDQYGRVMAIISGTDTTPPVISAVITTNLLNTSVTITWTTNEQATSQVEYGISTGYGSSTAFDGSLLTSHSQNITGLTPGTLYHYHVKSRDLSGNMATSTDFTFTTAAGADTTPPVITVGPTPSSITSTGATISWTTNEASDSQVKYSTDLSYSSQTTLDATLVTSHSQNLTGLVASTTYNYKVFSKDAAGNPLVDSNHTFITSSAADTTPPVLSAETAGSITATSVTITWTTNENSSSQVIYGTTSGSLTNATSITNVPPVGVTSHSVPLSGLTASTPYYYRCKSKDLATNEGTSAAEHTFTTGAGGGGTLNTGLVSYWDMNESSASATRIDHKTNNDLTAYNNPAVITGKLGNAASGGGASTLYCADNSTQNFGSGGMTIAGWIKIDSLIVNKLHGLLSKWGDIAGPSDINFGLYFQSYSNQWAFTVSSDGTGATRVDATISHTPTVGAWYFLVGLYEPAAAAGTQLRLYVYDSTGAQIGSTANAAFSGSVYHSSHQLDCMAVASNIGNVSVDEIGLWSRALTLTEISTLLNGGAGVSWPLP